MAEASPARRLLEQIERSSRNAEEPLGEFGDEAMSQLKAECAKLYSEVLRLMDGGDARVVCFSAASQCEVECCCSGTACYGCCSHWCFDFLQLSPISLQRLRQHC